MLFVVEALSRASALIASCRPRVWDVFLREANSQTRSYKGLLERLFNRATVVLKAVTLSWQCTTEYKRCSTNLVVFFVPTRETEGENFIV